MFKTMVVQSTSFFEAPTNPLTESFSLIYIAWLEILHIVPSACFCWILKLWNLNSSLQVWWVCINATFFHLCNCFYSRTEPLKQTVLWNVTRYLCFAGGKQGSMSWPRLCNKSGVQLGKEIQKEEPVLTCQKQSRAALERGQLSSGSCVPCELTSLRDGKVPW